MAKADTIHGLTVIISKAHDIVVDTLSHPADGLNMSEAFYIVKNINKSMTALTDNMRYLDRVQNKPNGY